MAYSDQAITYQQDLTADDSAQLIDILTPIYDGGDSARRKDPFSLKFKVNTDGCFVDVYAVTDNFTTPSDDLPHYVFVGTIQTDSLMEVFFDVSEILGVFKTIQFRLIGVVTDFQLSQITLDFGLRPEQSVYFKLNLMDLGIISPNKKRMRVWPVTLEVTNNDLAYITPIIDGVPQTALVVQSDFPQTFNYQFTEDQWGKDFSLVVRSCCPMEIYKVHVPIGVQILPIGKQFDQIGPEEFFRFGKVSKILIRLIAFGGTAIPYKLYFQDDTYIQGTLTVLDGAEDVYEIGVPKTVAGTVMRFELGPTAFEFHRYYAKMQVAKSGRDTENEWISMTDQWAESQSQQG